MNYTAWVNNVSPTRQVIKRESGYKAWDASLKAIGQGGLGDLQNNIGYDHFFWLPTITTCQDPLLKTPCTLAIRYREINLKWKHLCGVKLL